MRAVIALALILRGACAGQAYVTNAVGASSSANNVLAPQMLATLVIYSYSAPVLSGAGGSHVLIRPAGSLQAIPATVVSNSAAASSSITFLTPAGIATGSAELIWQFNGSPYQSVNVMVAPNNFELMRNGSGGTASAQVLSSPGAPSAVGLSTPARPGQTVALAGSGMGYGTQVAATVGGKAATVVYAGRGTPAGMDQIQLQIPSGVADGCYVPLVLNVGSSVVSSSISVTATGAPCLHPLGLTSTDLKNLDSGASLNVVEVDLSTGLNAAPNGAAFRQEAVNAYASPVPPNQLAQHYMPAIPAGCIVPPGGTAAFIRVGDFSSILSSGFDPGGTLTLQSGSTAISGSGLAGFYTFNLPAPVDGIVAAPPAPLLAAGKWTLTTAGSADVPASTVGFTLPPPVQISGAAPVSMRRDSDQTLSWNGSGWDSAATAQILLSGHAADGVTTRTVVCTASANSAGLTIPAAYLAPFAPGSIGTVQLTLTPGAPAGATVKTNSGASVAFIIAYTTSDTRPVDFP
jgi:uncharacterized protein (TIGR03437 family)